jgi:hypothetical protein
MDWLLFAGPNALETAVTYRKQFSRHKTLFLFPADGCQTDYRDDGERPARWRVGLLLLKKERQPCGCRVPGLG